MNFLLFLIMKKAPAEQPVLLFLQNDLEFFNTCFLRRYTSKVSFALHLYYILFVTICKDGMLHKFSVIILFNLLYCYKFFIKKKNKKKKHRWSGPVSSLR